MSKLIFAHTGDQGSGGGSGGGDSAKPGGWDPVFTQEDDGKAPSLSPINPNKSDAIVLKPKKAKTRTPDGIHRDVIDENLGTGAPAQVAVGMGDQSESNHEYKYAPGLTPMAGLVFSGELAQTYQERQSNVSPQDPPGYPDRVEDSNNTPRRPGRRGDRNVQLDRLPGDKSYPSGSPEPPDGADIGVGNMVYPLAGAAAAPVSGPIYGAGFIAPDGTPYPMSEDESGATDQTHGQWIEKHLDWLQAQGFMDITKELVDDYDGDALRDVLVEDDKWIHVFNQDMLSVDWLDHATEALIRKAYLDGDIDKPSDGLVKVWQRHPDKTVTLDLSEEESPLSASLSGILFIKGGEFKEVVEDPENFLRFTYIWTSEPNRLPSSVLVQVADLNEPGTSEEQPSMTLVIGPDGQWVMDKDASGNWVPRPPTHEHPEADFPQERMPVAYESAVQHLPKVLKDVSAKVMKKLGQQQTGEEKDDAPKGKSYNVLEDPALDLAPGITPEEKIFTTIQDWDGDTFYGDVAKLDKATLAILQEHPKSNQRKHKYFRWDYISQADVDKGAAKNIEEMGYTVGNEPALIVERLPAWKKVEDQVKQARKEKAAS